MSNTFVTVVFPAWVFDFLTLKENMSIYCCSNELNDNKIFQFKEWNRDRMAKKYKNKLEMKAI